MNSGMAQQTYHLNVLKPWRQVVILALEVAIPERGAKTGCESKLQVEYSKWFSSLPGHTHIVSPSSSGMQLPHLHKQKKHVVQE